VDRSQAVDYQSKVSTEHSPWQVSQLSKSLKDWIEKLGSVWVEGELQSFQECPTGIFASIRDLDVEAAVEIHSFASNMAQIEVGLRQGDRVVALLQPQFWAKNGKLTMKVLAMHKVGLGELLERLERLKQQIIAEGLADPARKLPLPFLPNRIGLVTGANSDAEKDVLQNAKLRWPEVQFEVIHSHVQGEKAVAELLFALEQLSAMPEVDVIIIARGGGSFQDLLPFSDERLVRMVSAMTIPVVSAIGHENDQPLLDLVADLRASTPTDAAKRVVPDVLEERRNLSIARTRIRNRIDSYLSNQLQLLSAIRSRPVLASPFGFIDAQLETLLTQRKRIREIFDFRLQRSLAEVQQLKLRAGSLSPQLTLQRGYALITDAKGKQLKAAQSGDKIHIRTSKQEIAATVTEVRDSNG
jgi:exodeoxyribonuclease VII large subunit